MGETHSLDVGEKNSLKDFNGSTIGKDTGGLTQESMTGQYKPQCSGLVR